MADLVNALEGLFDGGDMSIVQATVSAVSQGVATVSYNGGEFTQVPYLTANYGGGQTYPSNSQKVYVIARRGWGMLIIGSPAPGPPRSVGSGTTVLWSPHVLAQYFNNGYNGWSVASSNQLDASSGQTGNWATEIFSNTEKPVLPSTGLSAAGFSINLLSAESGSFMGGGAYLEIGLFTNTTPAGALVVAPGTVEQAVYLNVNDPKYLAIPLAWANQLIAGTAHGIYVRSDGDYDLNQITLGALQLVFL